MSKEIKENTKNQGKAMKNVKVIKGYYFIVFVLISAFINIAGLFIYHQYYATKIVAFDLKGYIVGLRDMYLSGKINDEQLRTAIDLAEKAVLQAGKNKVVLMGDVVLTKDVEKIAYPVTITLPQVPYSNNSSSANERDSQSSSSEKSK